MNRYIAGLAQVGTALGVSLGCYLVSAHVAAERAGVAQLRVEIARDAEAMRSLDAELHTRARLPQLQSWNDQALLMSAPAPQQMLGAPAQLVAYLPGRGGAEAVQAVARTDTRAPVATPIPTAQRAEPDAAPIMAAQIAVRHRAPSPSLASLTFPSPLRGRVARAPSPTLPQPGGGTGERSEPGRGRAAYAHTQAADPVAELAARAPTPEPTTDVADLTQAIGRELKIADGTTRHVSLR